MEKAALAGIEANEAFFKSLDMPVCISELIGRKATEEEMRDMAVKATYFGRVKIGGFKVLAEDDIYKIYEMANH